MWQKIDLLYSMKCQFGNWYSIIINKQASSVIAFGIFDEIIFDFEFFVVFMFESRVRSK